MRQHDQGIRLSFFLKKKSLRCVKTLAADCVQKANSGHPGAPMGLAPAAHVLWSRHLVTFCTHSI